MSALARHGPGDRGPGCHPRRSGRAGPRLEAGGLWGHAGEGVSALARHGPHAQASTVCGQVRASGRERVRASECRWAGTASRTRSRPHALDAALKGPRRRPSPGGEARRARSARRRRRGEQCTGYYGGGGARGGRNGRTEIPLVRVARAAAVRQPTMPRLGERRRPSRRSSESSLIGVVAYRSLIRVVTYPSRRLSESSLIRVVAYPSLSLSESYLIRAVARLSRRWS